MRRRYAIQPPVLPVVNALLDEHRKLACSGGEQIAGLDHRRPSSAKELRRCVCVQVRSDADGNDNAIDGWDGRTLAASQRGVNLVPGVRHPERETVHGSFIR